MIFKDQIIAKKIGCDPNFAKSAASISKTGLSSEIVYEFPELQGIMGGKYLRNEGFCDDVSLAVAEQYLPRFSNDQIPSSIYGAILAISDKLENIISIYVEIISNCFIFQLLN